MNILPPIPRIGVFGHVGNRNLGDEALIAAVLQNVKIRISKAIIIGYTLQPRDTQQRHNITAFPITRDYAPTHLAGNILDASFKNDSKVDNPSLLYIKQVIKKYPLLHSILKYLMKLLRNILYAPLVITREILFIVKSVNNLKGVDLLIIVGSQQIIDFIKGPWGHPYNIFKWSVLAKINRTKVAFLCVGAGPVTSWLSKKYFRYAISNAFYLSCRDESSLRLCNDIGTNRGGVVLPDLVFSLRFDIEKSEKKIPGTKPIVGINPVPFSDPSYWPGSSEEIYNKYIIVLAKFAEWLIYRGYSVLFFPTQLKSDPPVIDSIKNILNEKLNAVDMANVLEYDIESFHDLVSAIFAMDMVVATRFHGVVIPLVLGKPVLGVAYHNKTLELMSNMGLSDYVVDIFGIGSELLFEKFELLEANKINISKKVASTVLEYRRLLDLQYDRIFGKVEI